VVYVSKLGERETERTRGKGLKKSEETRREEEEDEGKACAPS